LIRKARRSSAANHDGSGLLGSVFGRRTFATRAASPDAEGSSAPSAARARLAFATACASLIAAVALLATSVAPAAATETCPNEARREEQGAAGRALPDCRAYELVSQLNQPSPSFRRYNEGFPPTGIDVLIQQNGYGWENPLYMPQVQYGVSTAQDGDAALFEAVQPNSESDSIKGNLSRRTPNGWVGENIIPPQTRRGFLCDPAGYVGFSPNFDQVAVSIGLSENQYSYVGDCGYPEPPLSPGESRESSNLFLRDTATRSFQLVNVTPEGEKSYDPRFVTMSSDGSRAVFLSRAQLTSDAPNGETRDRSTTEGHCASPFGNVYLWHEGAVRLATVLPDGTPVRGTLAGAHQAGECGRYAPAESAGFTHAVSADGERILFYAGGGFKVYEFSNVRPNAPYLGGGLYLREHPGAEQSALGGSGECTEPAKACTIQIDLPQGVSGSGGGGNFQWANAEDTKVFFTDEEQLTPDATAEAGKPDLYEYDLGKPEGQRLTDLTAGASEPADVLGVSGASEDGSYLYFAAQSDLTGAQQNSHGESAVGPTQGSGTLGGLTKGTGNLQSFSNQVTGVNVSSGQFHLGQEITGQYIREGTTITACSPDCSAPSELTLSESVNETASGVELTGAGSAEVTGVNATSGAFHEGMSISGTGIPAHTWIKEVGNGSLTLSHGVTAEGAQSLSATGVNLYLRHAGATTFIAGLSALAGDQCDWTPTCLTSRVSQNGAFLAFDSFDQLTGYDNHPVHPAACQKLTGRVYLGAEEEPCPQAFRYSVAGGPNGELTCATCNPNGSPPASEFGWAVIPMANFEFEGNLGLNNAVSNAGEVFFETMEKLVPADENGTWDVYQYDGGEGAGAQLHLISSGKSEQPSFFADATPDGSNVFFGTFQSLLRADTRSDYDLYDARAGGGFAEPLIPPCEAESCRGAGQTPPTFSTPNSAHNENPGNPHEKPCPKGKVRRHGRCVSKHRRHHRRHHRRAARHNRRAGK
jgi:hypothetical protein